MPNQHEFQRVTDTYLKPLAKLFGKSPTDAQTEAFVEDLAEFTADELAAAVKVSRRARKFFPSIYDAMTDCEEARQALRGTAEKRRQQTFAEKNPDFWKEAEQVMRSEFGQMALREGWGSYLFVMTRRSGKTDWKTHDAANFRSGNQRGIEAAVECAKRGVRRTPEEQHKLFGRPVDATTNDALLKLWEGMQEREKALARRYLREGQAA